ncbi:MAG: hypothetical protein ACKO1X_04860 [Acidimicrobiales bacterium]
MRVRRILVAAATAVALAGCGADTAATESSSAGVPATDTQPRVGPADSAELVGGGTIDPVALSQATPVALWFWAPG